MRHLLAVLAVLSFAAVLSAQETPKYELFGGYSLLHQKDRNFTPSGWEASGAYNFNHWIGMKLDADGHYDSASSLAVRYSSQIHTLTVGPQFSFRAKHGTLFGHTLFGLAHQHVHERFLFPQPPGLPPTLDGSTSSFAVVLGGGGDWNISKRFGWRGQLDYLENSFFTQRQNFLRFSTGLVFRFGGR